MRGAASTPAFQSYFAAKTYKVTIKQGREMVPGKRHQLTGFICLFVCVFFFAVFANKTFADTNDSVG